MNLDDIPFSYGDLSGLEHRIIYYESSRGCPFSCSYCLSSIDKKVRFRSLSLVTRELQFFLDRKVPQVKFVDRTFNCKKSHSMAIWQYLLEHDNGITNFHFEISSDLLDDDELALDHYEGYPVFYQKQTLHVPEVMAVGTKEVVLRDIDAMIYTMPTDHRLGLPSTYYWKVCKQGYRDFHFALRYLEKALFDSRAEME